MGGQASFGQTNVPPGQSVSIGVKITPGLVADNKPHMEPNGSNLSSAAQGVGTLTLAAVTLLTAVGSPIVGVLWWRKNGRDQRYADLAPGTVPLPGQGVRIMPSDSDITITVAFSPPPIPVAEAGMLMDGQVDIRETAATIIDLAVRGALTVQSDGEHDFRVTPVDLTKASAPHETVLLTSLFEDETPGAERDLSRPGSLASPMTRCGIPYATRSPSAAGSAKYLSCRDQRPWRRPDRDCTLRYARPGVLDSVGARCQRCCCC